ncbi:helix-turn-helix domain-containing protein [Lactobacillus sp. DCY120]|uniref:Helix-turn-helix domain-containing protein n=1 Tax=Bombilactobacillus apium TaxID=2675299 RepID=A0A850R7J9_9LACO|nr:helix-turn-helix domain-containing protein [Bombilactobacillus apium]NVY96817.1 helix-turn-helix domain-containing protein [Bombilactobacillus apium]
MSELGQKLRTARMEQGYTIDDLQKRTKIQKRYLLAIEEGRFDNLPGDFYVRAFIKQYAECVNLDSEQLLTEYSSEVPQLQVPEESPVRSIVRKESLFHNLRRHLPQISILAIVLIIVVLVGLTVLRMQKQNANPIPHSTKIEEKVPAKKTPKNASSTPKPAAKPQEQKLEIKIDANDSNKFNITNWKTSNQHTLKLSATTSAAWITVRGANGNIWQGLVNAGTEKEVPLDNNLTQFQVQTGNAPVTDLTVNDFKVPVASKQTGTVHTYTMNIKE